MEKISVILIDSDDSSRRYLKEELKKIQRTKIAAETENVGRAIGLVKKIKPNIVVLDLFPSVEKALALAERISQTSPQTTLFVTSTEAKPDIIIRAMRAGAREFLAKPFDKDEVLTAFKNHIRWEKHRTAQDDVIGKMIAVFGVKGGVGATTIATNLAVNLAENTHKSVILVDLNLQLGNAALFLNLQPKYSIIDVANNLDNLDPNILRDILPKHPSGVRLLPGPARIEEAESLIGTQFEQILILLRSVFDYVVIDTHNLGSEFSLKALDESDVILAVATAELPSVYNARRCLDIFQRMGYSKDKLLLVINRHQTAKGVEFEDLEKSINYPVYWKIPNQDYTTVMESINQGTPISMLTPRAKVSQNLKDLAERMNGSFSTDEKETKTKNNQKSRFIKKLFLKKEGTA